MENGLEENAENRPKTLVEMPCFRRCLDTITDEYIQFEKELNMVDKDMPLKDRAISVLRIMDYDEQDGNLVDQLGGYMSTLLKGEIVDSDKATMDSRLRIAKILDDVRMKYLGGEKTVVVSEFLEDLKKVIMTPDEK